MTLRDLRLGRGLTLEALGHMAGLDIATISKIERGLQEPRPETVVKLARGLGMSVRRLVAVMDERERKAG